MCGQTILLALISLLSGCSLKFWVRSHDGGAVFVGRRWLMKRMKVGYAGQDERSETITCNGSLLHKSL